MTDNGDPSAPRIADADGERTRMAIARWVASTVAADAPSGPPPDPTVAGTVAAEPVAPTPAGSGFLLQPGTILNNTQRIEALIGRGGMGEVYRATNIHTGDQDAIKMIRPDLATDPHVRELFRREAAALRKVRHPSVVSYQGIFGDDSGRLFLVMDFVDGPSLASFIAKGPLAPGDVRRVGVQIAEGLAAAHAGGVVHRDLSPDNVVLRGGSLDHAVLIDFGVAKRLDGSSTLIGSSFAGKLDYCSPEQCGLYDGAVDHRTDIYSLGLLLAAAAIGKPLPMGSSLARAIRTREVQPDLSAVPEELKPDLARLLEPDPARRAQSMREVAALLRYDMPPAPATPPSRTTDTVRRLAWIGGGATVALVLIGAGAVVGPRLMSLASRPQDEGPELAQQATDAQRRTADASADEERRVAEARRQAEEEARRLEAERAAAERRRAEEEAQRQVDEARRLEAERAAAERQRADDVARRQAEEAQRQADEKAAAEAQRRVEEEKRLAAAAEAQRRVDEERRAAVEAQRRADEERRNRETAPPVAPPPRQPQQQASRTPAPVPVGVDGAWQGRICFRRLMLTSGNETCGPLTLSITGGAARGSWVVGGLTYAVSGAIAADGGRVTLEMPPSGQGLGTKFTLPLRVDNGALQGQGYTNNNVLVTFTAAR